MLRYALWARAAFKRFERELRPDLEILQPNPSKRKKLLHRQKKYIVFHLIYCRLIASLHSRALTQNEIRRVNCFSAMAPLLDDVQDKTGHILKPEDLKILMELRDHPQLSQRENQLAHKYISSSLNQLERASSERIQKLAIHFLQANQPGASAQYEKGPLAAVMYRLLLNVQLTDKEEKLVRKSGQMGQFIDDIFDYYEDREAGLTTMATEHFLISHLKTSWIQSRCSFLNELKCFLTENRSENSQSYYSFALLMHLPDVALAQYRLFTDQQGALKTRLQRKEYICDMELIPNRLRWIKMFLKSKI